MSKSQLTRNSTITLTQEFMVPASAEPYELQQLQENLATYFGFNPKDIMVDWVDEYEGSDIYRMFVHCTHSNVAAAAALIATIAEYQQPS